jgi:hypothetical protein
MKGKNGLRFQRRIPNHNNRKNTYLLDSFIFRKLIGFRKNLPSFGTAIAFDIRMNALTANIENQQSNGSNSAIPIKAIPTILVVMAATLVGTCCGILVAEGNAFSFLKQDIATQFEAIRSYLHISAKIMDAKLEATEVIPTGYPPVAAIHISNDPTYTSVVFETEAIEIVRTERLHNPDRIFFDLKEHAGKEVKIRELKSQKEISLNADLLSGVRIAQRKLGVTRIVLDLNRACNYTYQTFQGAGSRVAIEIRPLPNSVS